MFDRRPWWERDDDDDKRSSTKGTSIRSSHKPKKEKTPRTDTLRLKKIAEFPHISGAYYNLQRWRAIGVFPKGQRMITHVGFKGVRIAFFTALSAVDTTVHSSYHTKGDWTLYDVSVISAAVIKVSDSGPTTAFGEKLPWHWEQQDYWK